MISAVYQPRSNRRLELRFTQKQVAGRLGIDSWTVLNWENNNTASPIGSMSAMLRFVDY
jgi:transcriptional regulator with XRE-family HTH domain